MGGHLVDLKCSSNQAPELDFLSLGFSDPDYEEDVN